MIEQALENAYPEQLPNENNSYYSLFKWYLNTGKNRSIKNFTKESNKSERSLHDLSNKYFWKERAADFDQTLKETLYKEELTQIAKEDKEHLKNIIKMKQNITTAISLISDIEPKDLINEEDDNFTKIKKINKLMQTYTNYIKLYEKLEEAEANNQSHSENTSNSEEETSTIPQLQKNQTKELPFMLENKNLITLKNCKNCKNSLVIQSEARNPSS